MDNNNSMLETHFFDYLRSISDKQTVNPQEIYSIKGIMNRKEFDSLYGTDRDYLK